MSSAADRNELDRLTYWGAVGGFGELTTGYRYNARLSGDSAANTSALVLVLVHGDSSAVLSNRTLSTPTPTLSAYTREWVALSGTTVVAHGTDAADVVRRARMAGVQHPHVLFIEELPEGVARLGLLSSCQSL